MGEKITETAEPPNLTSPDTRDAVPVEDELKTEYMQGWALATLVLAFMSISFVLALDNTILGSVSSTANPLSADATVQLLQYPRVRATSKA